VQSTNGGPVYPTIILILLSFTIIVRNIVKLTFDSRTFDRSTRRRGVAGSNPLALPLRGAMVLTVGFRFPGAPSSHRSRRSIGSTVTNTNLTSTTSSHHSHSLANTHPDAIKRRLQAEERYAQQRVSDAQRMLFLPQALLPNTLLVIYP